MKPDKLCPKKPTHDFMMKPFYKDPMPPQLLNRMELFAFNDSTYDPREICKEKIKYQALVTFKLTTNTMSVTVSSRRLSFFDKLSGFGELSN